MLKTGLIGRKLGHSYSPQIHEAFQKYTPGYSYELFELEPEEVEAFMRNTELDGFNVTIPYKKAVIPFLSGLSETARATGSVNTVVRRADGSFFGDNTDVYGFTELLRSAGIDPAGRKALVLGSGGASVSVRYALEKLGAEVVIISRSGPDNYTNLSRHADARLLVNTTPVGMFPANGAAPLSIKIFPELEAVVDIIYNPARTELMLEAEAAGIPAVNGLYMLAAQGKRAAELFCNAEIPDAAIPETVDKLAARLQNLVLVRGSGESLEEFRRQAAVLARETGREPAEVSRETLAELGKGSGRLLAVADTELLSGEGRKQLYQNGTLIGLGAADPSGLHRSAEPGEEHKNMRRILVINGPNLNLLGVREPDIYGKQDYAELLRVVDAAARENGVYAETYQSNHEGDIVDRIQSARGCFDGIVINPAAYTHTSVAILDALKAVAIPAVEVHISNVSAREPFRQISYAGMACIKTYAGLGLKGYAEAIKFLAERWRNSAAEND